MQAARQAEEADRQGTIEMAKGMVSVQLRDPSSAVYTGVRLVKINGEKAVCGLVNSRNGFGGMSGNSQFVRLLDDPLQTVFIEGVNRSGDKQIDHFCS